MATNLVYKGDLAEVSLAKETGLIGHGTGTWVDGTTATDGWKTTQVGPTTNTSTIHVGEGMYWVDTAGNMMVPKNMLVGATLRFYDAAGNHLLDDYSSTKRTFYITANDADTITIQPRLATVGAAVVGTSDKYFLIDNLRVPTFDASCNPGTDERIKADQFLGLLNSFSLPESEIDVRKQHIVGMGRDVNVLTSGKETLSGGAFDTNAHSLRFFKYALGGHTALGLGEFSNVTAADTILSAPPLNIKPATAAFYAQQVGDISQVEDVTVITAPSTATGIAGGGGTDIAINADCLIGGKTTIGSGTSAAGNGVVNINTSNYNDIFENIGSTGVFKVLEQSDTGGVQYGYYGAGAGATTAISSCVDITAGAVATAIVANRSVYVLAKIDTDISAGDIRIDLGATNAAKFAIGDYIQIVDKDTVQIPGADAELPTLNKHEIRRVIGVGTSDGGDAEYVYVEEPFLFEHTAASCGVERMQYTWDSTNSIAWERGSPAILDSTFELKYGVAHNFFGYSYLPSFTIEQSFRQTDVTPGAEQMMRVYSGCKVGNLNCVADSEGELKVKGDYEAGRMFTDTTEKFITPHRMFENTANTQVNRRVSGIAVNGEKPYLFQHVSFEAFGASILRATNIDLKINNNNEARWYVRGTDGSYAAADQVAEASTQYAAEITEAARDYELSFSALVEDTRWFDELRQRKHHTNSNDITLTLTKPGSHATRQNAAITIEDYTVVKAEHPLPDDKGPVTADVHIALRHVKVTETNPYFTL